jgi:hypothetical protein
MHERSTLRLGLVMGTVIMVVGCGTSAAPSPVATVPSATAATSAPPSASASASAAAPSSAAASGSAAPVAVSWPAPPNPMELTVAAGLKPQPKEFLDHHVHAHLDVFVDGERVVVPAGIGIDIDDPNVRRGLEPDGSMSYGGIAFCGQACISPLHTHNESGVLHTESASEVPNTLGEFFIEWNVPLSRECVGNPCAPGPVAVYVDGQPFTGDPNTIELTDLKEIAIVLGTPPARIPSTGDFSSA